MATLIIKGQKNFMPVWIIPLKPDQPRYAILRRGDGLQDMSSSGIKFRDVIGLAMTGEVEMKSTSRRFDL